METAITSSRIYDMPPEVAHTGSDSAGITAVWELRGMTGRSPQSGIMKALAQGILKAPRLRIAWVFPDITLELARGEFPFVEAQRDAVWGRIAWASPDIMLEFAGGELPSATASQIEAARGRIVWASPNITLEFAESEQVFDAIQSLYLSNNKTRDRQIATRIIALYRDALAEDERILSASLRQFTEFFLMHPDLGFPRITLTPDSTLRVRWIHGEGNFVAIEFIGGLVVKLVAEIPRKGGLTAQYFSVESFDNVLSSALAIGATFA
jgi:hypothetical protein